jgi:broad specificity phosphatase PhoE
MPRLILVKHSLPEVVPAISPARWALGEEGRRRCPVLARHLEPYLPAGIICSEEPKAAETARLVAWHLDRTWTTAPGLHEHRREAVGWQAREAFEAGMRAFFSAPERLVFGEETAREAAERFGGAVAGVVMRHPDENVIVIAHGTVITLFVARYNDVEPFAFWQRLGLPSIVVLDRPGFRHVKVVKEVAHCDRDQMG